MLLRIPKKVFNHGKILPSKIELQLLINLISGLYIRLFTFNTIFLASLIYLLIIPISSMHYLSLKKKFSSQFDDSDDHEDIL